MDGGERFWESFAGKHVAVYARPDSFAARRAPVILRESDRAVDILQDILAPAADQPRARVAIYLTEPVGDVPGLSPFDPSTAPGRDASDAAADEVIVLEVQPESPGEPPIRPLTGALVTRWFGPGVAELDVFLDGIAGLVAARMGAGPSLADAHDLVRDELADGGSVSIVGRVGQAGAATPASAADDEPFDYVATSFAAYLVATFGAPALHEFFEAYDPERRDQAAIAAFQRPIGGLEEAWVQWVKRPLRPRTAIWAFVRKLAPLLRPYWRKELEVLALTLLSLGYGLAMPLSGKYLIDEVLPGGNPSMLVLFAVGLLAIFVVNGLADTRRAYVNTEVTQRVLIDLQERMFAHLQRLPHAFYVQGKTGDIMSRFSNDLRMVEQSTQVLMSAVEMSLAAIVAAVALLALNAPLGALVLGIVPAFAFSYVALGARLRQASFEKQRLTGEAMTALGENLSAHAVVKAFAIEDRAVAAYRTRLGALLKASLSLMVIAMLFDTSMLLAGALGEILVLGVGGYLAMNGSLTVGTLLAFIGLVPSLFTPVAALSNIGRTIQMASGSMDRVEELLAEPVTVDDQPGAAELPPLKGEIRLDHVTFAYDAERPVLQDVSLTIPAGTHLAVVGPSGSGKSSLASLLTRFWDPDEGRIFLDGHDLRQVTLKSLRAQIGIVFQDTFLFDTTIRENIAIGRSDATDAEVAAAAKAARLDEYIATLPAGYDTVIGERGVRMSGGQRQRLAIARALLREPRILILDEATSALDPQTEREILDTLAVLARGRTTISITHRLSLATMADQIVVLEQGRVVEQGKHADLVQSGGMYQRLYEEQADRANSHSARRGPGTAGLRFVPILSSLDDETLTHLARQLTLERLPDGEDVVRQGEVGDKLYLVKSGQAEVIVSSGHEERRVNLLGEGDYFGEMALLSGEPRTATVRTVTPTELYSLTREDFLFLLESQPSVQRAVAESMAERRAALVAVAAGAGESSEDSK